MNNKQESIMASMAAVLVLFTTMLNPLVSAVLAIIMLVAFAFYKFFLFEKMTDNIDRKNECCPVFEPKNWDEKSYPWQDKLFLQDEVRQLFHIPLNMGQVITRMWKKSEAAQASPKTEEFLLLCYDPSPWKSELYMTVTKDVPDGKMTKISGNFLTKVFDGPYNAVPKFIKQMDDYVAKKGKTVKKYYFHYAYCPKCAKKYGHNYMIAFAQVN